MADSFHTGVKKKSLFFAALLILLISSCNLFIVSPRARENVNDPGTQIIAFTAAPSGEDSITTMWTWRDIPNWMSKDSMVEEIKIIHSSIGYPEVYNPFAGESFTDKSVWSHEWPDLKKDSTHYFTLFLKIMDDDWIPSYKIKVSLPGDYSTGNIYSRTESFNIDNAGGFTGSPGFLDVTNSEWAVVSFDLPDDVYIANADIYISVTALTEITFAPLDGTIPPDDMEKWNRLADNSIVNEGASATFTVNKASYNITDVVRAAVIGRNKAVLIRTADGSIFTINNNASAPYIIADVYK